ncbi:ParB N-terminal domain-containing protein [Agrobacterium pusense]|uniref:ParB N-terminal domain-containing protein n=1 Tax=Agrobacterium pusense TaxID=648995 RepID=UPI0010ADFD15|nr:ParB N-terminal domain-containing protein [Agrobacterium pusense]WCK24656.1 ParB N-terminal domain-containing protein [Agrobacterium pusense]
MTAHTTTSIPDIRITPVQDIKLSDIEIPEDRARELDAAWAEALAFNIAAHGLINPITVRVVDGRHQLVTGLHRHAAYTLLEWDSIPTRISSATSDDDARLEEVSENLIRHDLTARDRCHHLFDLKQIHQRKYPQTKNGGNRGNQHTGGRIRNSDSATTGTEIFGFTEATAQKTGLSKSVIAEDVKIWKDLTPDSRTRTAGTRFANTRSALKELSEQSPVAQAAVLDLLLADPPAAATVSEAVTIFCKGTVMTPAEKKLETVKRTLNALPAPVADAAVSAQVDARLAEMKKNIAILSKFFADLKDDDLDSVIDQNEDRVIASLKRRGRIQ